MADFQSNECITSLYSASLHTHRAKYKITIWHSSSSSFFSRPSAIVSYLLMLVYIYKSAPFSAPFSSAQCSVLTNVLYLLFIQTPDQISVPCTMPYFHMDTLTPPSSSRSPPLTGGRSAQHVCGPRCISI